MIKNLKEIIHDLSVLKLKSYLIAQGWHHVEHINDKAIVLAHKGFTTELVIPLRKDLGDFTIRMAELLSTLSEVENRPMLSVVGDINKSGFDIIRVRITEGAIDGSISFLTTSEVIHNSKEMLLAAASAAQKPRKLYGARKTDEALDYLNKVRVGQTEFGSYILTFLSPVLPKLSEQLLLIDDMEIDDDPFERRTTKMLLKGLNAAKNAAINSLTNGGMEAFEKAVTAGVSANLCDAIANIVMKAGCAEISLTWAKVRPISNQNLKEKIFFDQETAEILAEAARNFKLTEPLLSQSLTGWIYQLRQEQSSDPKGTIYLQALVNDKPKKLKIVLSDHDYQKATLAHANKNMITLEGDLYLQRKTAELINPRNLIVEDQND